MSESKCIVMDPYKGELMMTQVVQAAVKSDLGKGGIGSNSAEHTVPILRLLYSFHSSGTEIRQLIGLCHNFNEQTQL